MYELSRIRLYSIGPAGARYADTVLDLRGVGDPVPSPAPTQAEFFEEEPVGPPRRPAPAGVLFLENGGGKSVLLKLIFSVMLPGHRNTLGGASSGVLRKFLLADDCGHVALEWQHTVTGETVVVGKVSEWRGRQVSNDPRKFAEAWYSFRPGPGMSLDSLPVAESAAVRPAVEGASTARGRRRTMKGFRDALTEAVKAYPHLDVVWVEIHERWNEHLGELGLDPELFRYQREMNADEGEAAGLFAVKNDSDFTDLLLRAVTDTRDTDGLADLVHGFAHKLGRRAELTAEREFTAGSLDLLQRIADAAERREQARGVHAGAERRTRTLARRLSARGAEERARAAGLAERVASAAEAVTAAEGARGRSDLVAAEIAYRHASLALTAAEKGAAAQRRELNDARTLHSAWQAAETVLRHRAAADRSARVAAAILEAERDAAPALAARAKAAADLVRALHAAAEDGERVANEEEERSAGLQEAGEAAHRDATSAATAAQRARSDAEHLRQRLTEVEQETAEAVRAGWLDDSAPDADPARAALAASDAEKTTVAAFDEARETARRTADHAKSAAAEEARAELAAARAVDAARAAESAYDAERRVAEALGAERRLVELLGLPQLPAAVPAPRAAATRPSPAEARAARGVTVRLPDADAAGRRGTRALPTDSDRTGWITVHVDEEDADDIGLSQLPAAFRAAPSALSNPLDGDHAYAPEQRPTDTLERLAEENCAAPPAAPENGPATPGPAPRLTDAAHVEDVRPHGGPLHEAGQDTGAPALAPTVAGPAATGPASAESASPTGELGAAPDVHAASSSAARLADGPAPTGSVTGPVGEAGPGEPNEGDAASVGDRWAGWHGAGGGEDGEVGSAEASRRRPLAAESRPAGRVTVRIDEADDDTSGGGGPRPEGRRGGAPNAAADSHGDGRHAGPEAATAASADVSHAAPHGGARVAAAESRPSGEVSARVGDGDDGQAEGEAAATDAKPDGQVTATGTRPGSGTPADAATGSSADSATDGTAPDSGSATAPDSATAPGSSADTVTPTDVVTVAALDVSADADSDVSAAADTDSATVAPTDVVTSAATADAADTAPDDSDCWSPELGGEPEAQAGPDRDRTPGPGPDRGRQPRAAARPAPKPLIEGPLTAEELDRSAEALRELLEESVGSAERQLFELRTAAAEDARILGALGDGGLLPPSADVLVAVEFLGEHGIPALPGWRYLAQAVDPADHAAVLAARPELVDGVVITDPGTHARAREVLGQASLLPRSAVAVGTSAALLAPTPAPGAADSGVFLVPPNPAMHDERAADDERRELRARATARDEEIRALAARLAGDRALSARLASWRTGCPSGRLAELAAAAETARESADTAQGDLVEARTARAEADEAATEAARVRDERQEAAQRARRVADALAGLAYRLRERATWQTRLRELAEEAAEYEERAAGCVDRARAADEDRRAAQRAADDARRTARALRAERAEIAGAPDDLGEDTEPPTVSLPALREAYRAASQVYEKVGVGADLRAEQARAESDESAALATLDRLTNKVRTRAAQLLEGTDGADGPSRQAAAARAESLVQMLESRASAASEQLGRLRGEAERLAPADGDAHTELPEELAPADAEQAKKLLRTANGELAARTDALDTARTAHADLVRAHRAAEDAAGGFDETAALLRDLLRDGPGAEDDGERPEPYAGDLAEARQAAAETRRSLRGCAADLSAAESSVREASDVLVRHANSTRYEQVRTPARQQIRELPAAALPEHAAAWAEAFAPRLRVLTDELEQLERNRDSIVDRLRGLVESCLATLRSAQRLSRLPEGLGEWSGQEFLRIRFEDPDQASLTERLGEVIDEATRSAVRKNSDLRRDGMSLLLRGVHAALQPRGVAVEILKPDAVLRAERVPVGQMGDVFSGGQLLTAAIALYCTMAALRSNDRGRDKHRHAGTLFLDNPIGRANATYLLELQRAVADALGVQLLYTTGLFDTTALAEFPLVIRLRNDADLRAGLKYISVEEHLRPGLPVREPEEEQQVHGQITATRMYRRPEADVEAPAEAADRP
ncbi:hypothetical protein VT50_0222170 [Streptomyces antioxidans]|uniref:Chromosome segregation ATPase n=1 Tax=Streptomyces antioxidans TaxID=1507734 RepID=A0A1V4D230_9ACTN|nr:hypothetical protein [Streptomyces antioxidans]OPF76905.1 hypothetical protein VT50_0222170 [Streptomyces antioxidans]